MAKRKSTRRAPAVAPAAVGPLSGAAIAVYVLLGLLVIGTSYYTGYLMGKSSDGATVRQGSVGTEKLTIIEYSDFECPFCSRAAPTVAQLKQAYGDRVEVVYKHFPLESIHPNAFNAALAAECVRQEGGEDAFWEYHDTLFANQNALDAASLKRYAQQQGIDINACLDSQETAGEVRAHMAEAQQRGVRGTPSFWIGDELVVGALPYETLKAKVDEKLSGAPVAPSAPTQPTAPAAPQAPAARVDLEPGNYFLGDADAPVTIIEFTDYQCPFCKRAHDQTYPQILDNYVETGKVRYTVRHFPLPFHTQAQKASEAAECAGKVGGGEAFWEYHDALFANQNALDVASLKRYAGDLGLNQASFDSCLDSGEFAALVQNDLAVGSDAGVSGTPSFFVNGQIVVGAQPYNVFQAAIDAELQ